MVAEAEALRAQREYLENELVNKTANITISSLQVPTDLNTEDTIKGKSNRALTPSQLLPEDPPSTDAEAGGASTSNWR